MNLTVKVSGVPATVRMLAKLGSVGASPAFVRAVLTGEIAELITENFRQLNSARNAHGSNFYEREGVNRTQPNPDTGKIVIASRPIAHKLRGGIIRPRNAKSLAIPMSNEAYGKSPKGRQIAGLTLVVSRRSRKAFLATKNPDGTIRELHYALVKSVRQRAQSEVLPSAAEIEKTVQDVCTRIAQSPLGASR